MIAVDAHGADTLIVDANLLAKAVAAIDRGRRSTAPRLYRAALGAGSRGRARELLASTHEVLAVGTALGALRAVAAFDRIFATVWKRAAFDWDPERRELGDDLFAGLGLAARFFRVVAATIAIPAEVSRGTIRLLAAAEDPVGDRDIATTEKNETERQ